MKEMFEMVFAIFITGLAVIGLMMIIKFLQIYGLL